MGKLTSDQIIDKVRNNEEVKCPKCGGSWFAYGDPKTARCFECSKCHIRIFIDDIDVDTLLKVKK